MEHAWAPKPPRFDDPGAEAHCQLGHELEAQIVEGSKGLGLGVEEPEQPTLDTGWAQRQPTPSVSGASTQTACPTPDLP